MRACGRSWWMVNAQAYSNYDNTRKLLFGRCICIPLQNGHLYSSTRFTPRYCFLGVLLGQFDPINQIMQFRTFFFSQTNRIGSLIDWLVNRNYLSFFRLLVRILQSGQMTCVKTCKTCCSLSPDYLTHHVCLWSVCLLFCLISISLFAYLFSHSMNIQMQSIRSVLCVCISKFGHFLIATAVRFLASFLLVLIQFDTLPNVTNYTHAALL